jgi:recombinational DNA repair ATPase RecF
VSTFTYNDLLSWSERLPLWQRDALRRILTQTLQESDVNDFVALVKAQHGIPDRNTTANPADAGHVPLPGDSRSAITLTALRDIANVNALASGPITFAPEGLTVFYGDNASGKSGIARILKRAAHARDQGGPIRPNVFEPSPGTPASAVVEFRANGADNTYAWRDGVPTNNELKQINVFDARCAVMQVEGSNRLSYTPTVLKIFEDLALVCQKVAARLRTERDALEDERPAEIPALPLNAHTAAQNLVASLSAQTRPADIDMLCDLTDEEHRTRVDLARALQNDSAGQITLLETKARNLLRSTELTTEINRLLSDSAIHDLESAISEAAGAEEAARHASQAFSANSLLPGVGTAVWKELWESARRYSRQAVYQSRLYPVVSEDALCVLCQQPIGNTAAERLKKFEEFVQGDVQLRAQQARHAVRNRAEQLGRFQMPMSGRLQNETALRGTQLGRDLKAYIVAARLRRRYLLRKAAGHQAPHPIQLPTCPDLTGVRASVLQETSQLRTASQSEARRRMQSQLLELDDRLKLSPLKNVLKREVARLAYCRILDLCRSDCDTTWITRKSGEVARILVTGRLRSAFASNLAHLGFASAPVEVKLGAGSAGQYPYEVSLVVREDVPPAEILSEGERTCIALAGFIAELETSNNCSGMVLDDPVSSLDHHYRVRVARLLVEAARRRQVVVFTHDIVFLLMLSKYARNAGVALKECSLRRGTPRHGIPEDGPPWVAMQVSKRIGVLRSELQAAEALLHAGDRRLYDQKAEWIYDRLRQSWERAVEEVLLNGVVVRFGDGVSTQRLRGIADITEVDVQTVDTEMSNCSRFVHDESGAVNSGIPDPPVIRGDIDRLDQWIRAVRNRRQ